MFGSTETDKMATEFIFGNVGLVTDLFECESIPGVEEDEDTHLVGGHAQVMATCLRRSL